MTFNELTELSPPALLALALLVLGRFLKQSPVANWLIPFLLVAVGAVVFPLIAEIGAEAYKVKSQIALNAVYGGLIGAGAVGINQGWRQWSGRKTESGETKFLIKKK